MFAPGWVQGITLNTYEPAVSSQTSSNGQLELSTPWARSPPGTSSCRLRWFKRFFEGEPLIIVRDGEPIARTLRRERLTIGDVMEHARMRHIASLDTVEWAVLEQNLLLKEPKETV